MIEVSKADSKLHKILILFRPFYQSLPDTRHDDIIPVQSLQVVLFFVILSIRSVTLTHLRCLIRMSANGLRNKLFMHDYNHTASL